MYGEPATYCHHHGNDVIVRCPFHPRLGECINVIGMNRYGGESYLIIMQPDGTRVHLPPWMTWEEATHMRVVVQPELPHTVLVELERLIDAAVSPVCCQHTGDTAMRKRVIRQRDLFDKARNERLLPAETLSAVVAQLEVLMQSVIDAIETKVRDEQDPR